MGPGLGLSAQGYPQRNQAQRFRSHLFARGGRRSSTFPFLSRSFAPRASRAVSYPSHGPRQCTAPSAITWTGAPSSSTHRSLSLSKSTRWSFAIWPCRTRTATDAPPKVMPADFRTLKLNFPSFFYMYSRFILMYHLNIFSKRRIVEICVKFFKRIEYGMMNLG